MSIIALTILPLCLFLIQLPLEASPMPQGKPQVKNVNLEINEDIAIITYDLVAEFGQTYEVEATLVKENDPNFRIPVKSATGDIGEGNFAGSGRRIQWDWKKDLPKDFTGGPDYSIEVTATLVEGGSGWVYYVLGGVVVAGGAAAAVLSKQKPSTPTTTQSTLPAQPPGRPF